MNGKPKVLNLKDIGYKVPENAVYIGRAMPRYHLIQSKWANPFRIGEFDGINPYRMNRQDVINRYREYILNYPKPLLGQMIKELKGKDLVCWCYPEPCHGDILLELANKE